MTTDMQQDTASSAPERDEDRELADPRVAAGEEANALMAKTRYEAYRLVTEARTEAETILADARTEAAEIVRSAQLQAESIIDAAHLEASDVRAKAPAADTGDHVTDPSAATGADVAELEAEHAELTKRVSTLRGLADQLEQRFAALAASAQPTEPVAPRKIDVAALGPPQAPVLDHSPSVTHPVTAPDTEPEAPTERGSFYSRRSAKLPSIGDAGGKSALDMMRAIRANRDADS